MNDSDEALERYRAQLNAWSRALLERLDTTKPGRRAKSGHVSREYVALDLMTSVISAYEGDAPPESVLDALPVRAWREDTVPIPRAWIKILAEGWMRYKDAQAGNSGRTLGECLGIEGGAGKSPVAKTERTRSKNQRLANKASRLIMDGMTREEAFARVADDEDCSPETVNAAHDKLGQPFMERYRDAIVRRG